MIIIIPVEIVKSYCHLTIVHYHCVYNITAGDARNEVSTKLQKLPAFDPNLYKANAYRSLAYDPLS